MGSFYTNLIYTYLAPAPVLSLYSVTLSLKDERRDGRGTGYRAAAALTQPAPLGSTGAAEQAAEQAAGLGSLTPAPRPCGREDWSLVLTRVGVSLRTFRHPFLLRLRNLVGQDRIFLLSTFFLGHQLLSWRDAALNTESSPQAPSREIVCAAGWYRKHKEYSLNVFSSKNLRTF